MGFFETSFTHWLESTLVLVGVFLDSLCFEASTHERHAIFLVPSPLDHVVLTPQSAMKISVEVTVRESKEFMANKYDNFSNMTSYLEVFSIPCVKMFISLVDK